MICEKQIEVTVFQEFSLDIEEPSQTKTELVVLEGVRPFPVSGAGLNMIFDETPTGLVNGSNLNFQTQFDFQLGGLLVYLNGLRQRDPQDYTETSTQTFSFTQAPLAGDQVRIDYLRL
jgi:hypothetical protein